ncbi:MAG: hypothetical protein LBO65_10910 [Spirochaetaceae bacterium]|jgi:hypothetical protein|nr:hypothetical protein [Spirochaetaceae bacterium]
MGQKVLGIILLLFFGLVLYGQISGERPATLPRELLRPQYGEEPRFPRDYVIGELGQGDAPEGSYQAARRFLADLVSAQGRTAALPEHRRTAVMEPIAGLGIRAWRIGGGRMENDGSISFLVRFLGREKGITGELYLRQEEAATSGETAPRWTVDDILLEAPRSLAEGKYSPGAAEMTPYERFF